MSDKILDFLPPMIVGLAFFYTIAAVITAALEARRRSLAIRTHAELLNRVLDKFGTSRDFVELSESPAGKRLFEVLGAEPNGIGEKILAAVQRGVVLSVLGVGVLLLSVAIQSTAVEEFIRIIGAVCLALGLGHLGSSVLSYRLARSMGILGASRKSSLESGRV